MSIGISERLDDPNEQQKAAVENEMVNLRVSIPGIIQSFNPATQTASVQPALMENIKAGNADPRAENLPILSDVPVQFPRGGNYVLTFPVKKGDECQLVFNDMCIDGWYQSGGVQAQMELRRHDLSDAVAHMGIYSQPNIVPGFSFDTVQLRSLNGDTSIEIDEPNINMTAKIVTINGDLEVSGEATISGIAFTPHVHSGVTPGGGTSGPPQG